MKAGFLILIVLLLGCTNQQNQSTKTPEAISVEPSSAPEQPDEKKPWKLITSTVETRKTSKNLHIKTEIEGVYGNPLNVGSKLYVEVIFAKSRAGFFLHEEEKSAELALLYDLVIIEMQNSRGDILSISTNYRWSEAGGIMVTDVVSKKVVIDNSFTKLTNFILASEGEIKVLVKDKYASVYRFIIDATGFGTEFSKL